MYGTVPSYVDRRLKEAERSEQKLPYEPSFGWVGRTDFHIPYTSQGKISKNPWINQTMEVSHSLAHIYIWYDFP